MSFDNDPMKIAWAARAAAIDDIAQTLLEVSLQAATDATILEHDCISVHGTNQQVIETNLSKLIDQHHCPRHVGQREYVLEQCGLSAAKKTGQQRERNPGAGGCHSD